MNIEESDNKETRDEIFSRAVRAGKRTYFFDVKATRSDEHYLTITESKRRFDNEQGKFYYEKHKLFLYKEDFEKFSAGLRDVIGFIETGEMPVEERSEADMLANSEHTNIEFEDLDVHTEETVEALDKDEK